jgi:short-subunit dehydrogenase involved in D-alanine esterification of teichoic acids
LEQKNADTVGSRSATKLKQDQGMKHDLTHSMALDAPNDLDCTNLNDLTMNNYPNVDVFNGAEVVTEEESVQNYGTNTERNQVD